MDREQYGDDGDSLIAETDLRALPLSQKIAVIVNIGLLLSIAVSIVTLLPLQFSFVDRRQLRLMASTAVIIFLNMSFWLAGWPGSALGITLLGVVLAFSALVGQGLGLVGAVLSFMMTVLAVLLMVSDVPALKDGEWVSQSHLPIYIGLSAMLIVTVLSIVLWVAFGGVTYGF